MKLDRNNIFETSYLFVCFFLGGDTKFVFTPSGKTALPGKDIMDIDL